MQSDVGASRREKDVQFGVASHRRAQPPAVEWSALNPRISSHAGQCTRSPDLEHDDVVFGLPTLHSSQRLLGLVVKHHAPDSDLDPDSELDPDPGLRQ